MNPATPEDRFASLAARYDGWIDWEPRLRKELPFLLDSLPPAQAGLLPELSGILDVGCGTGAHAIALAAAGYHVTGLDLSQAMLEQARSAEERSRQEGRLSGDGSLRWAAGDITDPAAMRDRWFRAVLALGNALLSLGEEGRVLQGLQSMVRLVAPGGILILQYLNAEKIRRQGRLAVKAAPASDQGQEIWLRHHFEAGGEIYFHSYVLRPEKEGWAAEAKCQRMLDLSPEKAAGQLKPHFDRVEFFDGLSGREFSLEASDSLGVRASGRR
jgi:SAM-dependent methyltransferase